MSIRKDKQKNEGLFNRIINFVFFGDINKVVDKATKAIEKVDPEANEKIRGGMAKLRNDIDEWNRDIEEYCRENPNTILCKEYRKQGSPKMKRDMEW